MSLAVAPLLALRTAVVAIVTTPPLAWYTTIADAGAATPYAVWTAGTEGLADVRVFQRGSAALADEFSIYADQSDTLAASERAYALYAALKTQLDGRKIPLGVDALGRAVQTVRATLTLTFLDDDPDVPGRARAACRLDATVWSA